MKKRKIVWKELFTREYPFFIVEMAMSVYGNKMKEMVGWGYRDVKFVSDKDIITVFYSMCDAAAFNKFYRRMSSQKIFDINTRIRKAAEKLKKQTAIFCETGKEDFIRNLKSIYLAYQWVYSMYRFTVMVDLETKENSKAIMDSCIKTRDYVGRAINYADINILPILKKRLSNKFKISERISLYMTFDEIMRSLVLNKLIVSKEILERRYQGYVYRMEERKILPLILLAHKKRSKKLYKSKVIKGQSAQKGKVVGLVKLILNKADLNANLNNKIIVAKMTTVDFISHIQHIKSIITDEGGLTCHAAIVSRELKIPCIVGTKIATKVLKDGDKVEVDAIKGMVRKIEK